MEYDTQFAQNLSTLAVAGLGLILTYVAMSARRYHRYGREALLCASAFLISQAAIRTLSINDVITADTARLLVGVSAFTAFAILAQIGWLRRKDSLLRNGNHHDKENP